MTVQKLRIDFVIPFLIAFAICSLINFSADQYIKNKENTKVEVEYSDSKPGAAADKTVPVVTSIDEMMKEQVFTFHMDSFLNDYKIIHSFGKPYYVFTLPSKETILIDLYFDHICWESEQIGEKEEYSPIINSQVYTIMPVGKVVKEPLSARTLEALEQKGLQLTDTSFYVDMHGDYETFDAKALKAKVNIINGLVGIAVFLLIRWLMIASGMFPPLFPLRFLKSWKRFIIYNGILYYDENIKEIHELHKQENINAAAQEFCKLTGVNMEEAIQAMRCWKGLYREGILLTKANSQT